MLVSSLLSISILATRHQTVNTYSLDLTQQPPLSKIDLGLGTTRRSNGESIQVDSLCLRKNGKPWLPVCGEFQFGRYPRAEWRDELLKMKAGGVDVIATYLFWNQTEQDKGTYDWKGQNSLREFLLLCKEVGLLAFVRPGPWVHGESRNGGFPDWLEKESKELHYKLRNNNPQYMANAKRFYQEVAKQMSGLLWKDQGPVIGIQLDNECGDLDYLFALKKAAREYGIDVPLYAMTGWAVPIPDGGIIPVLGRYGDAFWLPEGHGDSHKSYFITPVRDDNDMGVIGGRVADVSPELSRKLNRYPYFCAEVGGGMANTYDRRMYIDGDDTASLALARIASGTNLLGYYIYHGGIFPDGKYSPLNESRSSGYPNELPVKDYDFNAPITSNGIIRESYRLLRPMHLFLQDFGATFASMRTIITTAQPKTLDDVETLRWSVRSDGKGGYILFNNFQLGSTMTEKPSVQFSLKTQSGTVQVPRAPFTIPSGSYGLFPFNVNYAGAQLDYATAQPVCNLSRNGAEWFFFMSIQGIPAEFKFANQLPQRVQPSQSVAFSVRVKRGKIVNFVVLSPEDAKQFWKGEVGGATQVALSTDTVLGGEGTKLRVVRNQSAASTLKVLSNRLPTRPKVGTPIFETIASWPARSPQPLSPECVRGTVLEASKYLPAPEAKAWNDALVWKLPIPAGLKGTKSLLRLDYTGDALRIYSHGKLVADNYSSGRAFEFGLWRLPKSQQDELEIKILPLLKKDWSRLPSVYTKKLKDQEVSVELRSITADQLQEVAVPLGRG